MLKSANQNLKRKNIILKIRRNINLRNCKLTKLNLIGHRYSNLNLKIWKSSLLTQ